MIAKNYMIPALVFLAVLSSCKNTGELPVLTKQWGEFGEKPGQFRFPAMIAAGSNGSEIYVVDQHNHRIQKFDSDGNFILMWGTMGNDPGQFKFPYGIATDSKGYVYVTDMNNHRIQKFTSGGKFISLAGSYGSEKGLFRFPYGIAIDDNDILYVLDAFNYRIQKFSTELEFIAEWGNQESIGIKLYMPHEIAIGSDGSVILSDRQNHRISVFTGEGSLIRRFGQFGEGDPVSGDRLSEPHGIATDRVGDILVCDRYNFKISKFTSDGEIINDWTTSGTFDNSSHFPLGILVSGEGTVYVTDHFAHCVQKYN